MGHYMEVFFPRSGFVQQFYAPDWRARAFSFGLSKGYATLEVGRLIHGQQVIMVVLPLNSFVGKDKNIDLATMVIIIVSMVIKVKGGHYLWNG